MSAADTNKLELVRQMVETMEDNLASIKTLIDEILGKMPAGKGLNGSKRPMNGVGASAEVSGSTIVEGVFNGESMVGPDGKKYPVPPNYASKSKLVSGDILKLTIAANGSFIYKQIGPVERVQVVGTLKKLANDFYAHTPEGEFRILSASVTYFKAEPGDQVTVIVPAGSKGGWAALENVIPAASFSVNTAPKHATRAPRAEEVENFQIPKTLFERSDD